MKIKKYMAGIGLCSIILDLYTIKPNAANFIKCNEYVNIRQNPYIQSAIVGYIYNDNIIQNIQQEKQGWIKIKSGAVEGWISKQFVIQDNTNNKGYTVAKIHPKTLSVYIAPKKDSIIYTTVYQNQQVECIQYKNDWLELAFPDGTYGFIDAYQAQLKTYYGTAIPIENIDMYDFTTETVDTLETFNYEESYDSINQSDGYYQTSESTYNYQQSYLQTETPQINYNSEQQYFQNENIIETELNIPSVVNEIEAEEEIIINDSQAETEDIFIEEDSIENNQQEELEFIDYEEYEDNIQQQQQEQQAEEIITSNAVDNYDIVSYADQFVGNPYVYGGNSLTDGIDCSHFVHQVLTDTGHYDGEYTTSDGWANLGESVQSLNNAQAGDVIVYPGHVAIYDGDGGIVEAKGSEWGITHDRDADHGTILAIRHFD